MYSVSVRDPLSYSDQVRIPNQLVSGFGCRIPIRKAKVAPKKGENEEIYGKELGFLHNCFRV
jgi:hypothetical protein